ncbi:hypothetical protein M413DRAFT_30832 [Hebeloma cylindrosporum]|uniref:Uncharacterized protein n=1 Tax=Hebeloma cylindrosporum TaxID=76867 RepID=A0A0C3BLT8_HEBCY|nr:hypothetical protein M413DRAFT_30832 [Hebeloma cylindrosporum h7]
MFNCSDELDRTLSPRTPLISRPLNLPSMRGLELHDRKVNQRQRKGNYSRPQPALKGNPNATSLATNLDRRASLDKLFEDIKREYLRYKSRPGLLSLRGYMPSWRKLRGNKLEEILRSLPWLSNDPAFAPQVASARAEVIRKLEIEIFKAHVHAHLKELAKVCENTQFTLKKDFDMKIAQEVFDALRLDELPKRGIAIAPFLKSGKFECRCGGASDSWNTPIELSFSALIHHICLYRRPANSGDVSEEDPEARSVPKLPFLTTYH